MGVHIRSGYTLPVLALVIVVCTVPVLADSAIPRVRPVGRRMESLLERGYAVSRTLSTLIDALERSDVIVHIEGQLLLGGGRLGETQFVAMAGGQRYLRIHLDPRIHDDVAIAMLGHELWHAWEIADARWVVDQETLAQLYMRIGYESHGVEYNSHRASRPHAVDTIQAHEAAREVLKELRAGLRSTD